MARPRRATRRPEPGSRGANLSEMLPAARVARFVSMTEEGRVARFVSMTEELRFVGIATENARRLLSSKKTMPRADRTASMDVG